MINFNSYASNPDLNDVDVSIFPWQPDKCYPDSKNDCIDQCEFEKDISKKTFEVTDFVGSSFGDKLADEIPEIFQFSDEFVLEEPSISTAPILTSPSGFERADKEDIGNSSKTRKMSVFKKIVPLESNVDNSPYRCITPPQQKNFKYLLQRLERLLYLLQMNLPDSKPDVISEDEWNELHLKKAQNKLLEGVQIRVVPEHLVRRKKSPVELIIRIDDLYDRTVHAVLNGQKLMASRKTRCKWWSLNDFASFKIISELVIERYIPIPVEIFENSYIQYLIKENKSDILKYEMCYYFSGLIKMAKNNFDIENSKKDTLNTCNIFWEMKMKEISSV
jgi:hypothetical protein